MGRTCRVAVVLGCALAYFVLSRPSRADWTTDGIPICTEPHRQTKPLIVSDDSGGVVVAWKDERNGTYSYFVQRVNRAGVTQWSVNGVALYTSTFESTPVIASDGAGGAIVAWDDFRNGFFSGIAQRVNGAGVTQWSNGVTLYTNGGYAPVIGTDGAGGVIVAWLSPVDPNTGNHSVVAQRVNGAGGAQWSNGVALCSVSSFTGLSYQAIVVDGAGGAIVTWQQGADIYAQRVNGAGVPQWSANGVPVCTSPNGKQYPVIASDGAGGCIVVWHTPSSNYDIHARRVNGAGVPQWSANGVALCSVPNEPLSTGIISDGASGAIVAWMDLRNGPLNAHIFAQRVNDAGVVQWPVNGMALCSNPNVEQFPVIASDREGGAIVAWDDFRSSNHHIYAQRVNGAGVLQWPADGTPLCTDPATQTNPVIASDGVGGCVVAWVDHRNPSSDRDIYAGHLNADGGKTTPVLLSLMSTEAEPGRVQLRWYLADQNMAANLYRRDDTLGWANLRELMPDASGVITYEDRDVTAGKRYGYRLALTENRVEQFFGEVWVDVPAIAQLALDGLRPNPSDRQVLVSFSLPSIEPVTIELLDLAGRQLISRSIANPRAGSHIINLCENATIPAGVYLVRLKQGGHVASRKACVVH